MTCFGDGSFTKRISADKEVEVIRGLAGTTPGAKKQLRQVAMYMSAPPITSTSLSAEILLVKDPSPKQVIQTALSLTTCSDKGISSRIEAKALRWKVPSRAAITTVFPLLAISSLNSTISGKNC